MFAFAFVLMQIKSGYSDSTQNLTLSILSSSNIITSGNPGPLTVNLDSSGTGVATDSSTTYTVTSNADISGTLQITGAITAGENMPTNTCLMVQLASNSGISQGSVELCTTSQVLVNQLPALLNDTASITYEFRVTNGWGVPSQTLTRTVTLTLTTGS